MFVVSSGVVLATRATTRARGSGALRAAAATRTGAQRETYGAGRNGRGVPGVNAGATGAGTPSATGPGPGVPWPDRAPIVAPPMPAASAAAQITSRERLTR